MRNQVDRLVPLNAGRRAQHKLLQMRHGPKHVRLVDRVGQESLLRRPTVEDRRPFKLQIVGNLGRSAHGRLESDVVAVNENERLAAHRLPTHAGDPRRKRRSARDARPAAQHAAGDPARNSRRSTLGLSKLPTRWSLGTDTSHVPNSNSPRPPPYIRSISERAGSGWARSAAVSPPRITAAANAVHARQRGRNGPGHRRRPKQQHAAAIAAACRSVGPASRSSRLPPLRNIDRRTVGSVIHLDDRVRLIFVGRLGRLDLAIEHFALRRRGR